VAAALRASRNCVCAEGVIVERGQVTRLPKTHDCVYIVQRNSFINAAMRIADDLENRMALGWSREFMRAMDTLWANYLEQTRSR